VQDAHPRGPRAGAVTLCEEVHVHVLPGLGVGQRELIERADELAVPGRHVEVVQIGVRVAGVEPVRVLELYRLQRLVA